MKGREYRFVPHARVPEFVALGWVALPDLEGTHHGVYAALMAWLCACPPAIPDDYRERERAMRPIREAAE